MNFDKFIKATVAFSLVAMLGTSTSFAQNATGNATPSIAKIFGGRAQYRTWSVGLHAGALAPTVLTGSRDANSYTNWDMNLGYGISVRKQLAHSFGLELSALRGTLSGSNKDATGGTRDGLKSFKSTIDWSVNLMGVVNVATIDFLRRENSVNFLVKAGFGMAGYSNSYVLADENPIDNGNNTLKQIPVGVGVKFKVSDRVNFDLGYNMYFANTTDLDGSTAATIAATNSPRLGTKDRYSYAYGGVELVLGNTSKPNLDWANPVAMMYDELRDPSIRKELDSLKKHVAEQDKKVAEQEAAIKGLLKDSDSDGVTDKFDKCPNTDPGVKVDGSGCPVCPLNCPSVKGAKDSNQLGSNGDTSGVGKNGNIQFEFDSSVLKTSSYPVLDQLASDVKAKVYSGLQLDGYASIEGTSEYNMQLSIDRANSVKTFLVNAGIPSNKIGVKGYGTKNPIASNDTEEGRIQNRRVEIKKKK